MRAERSVMRALVSVLFVCLACAAGYGQAGRGTDGERRRGVRSVTIPVTVRLPKERAQPEEFQYIEGIKVFEDGEPQVIVLAGNAEQRPDRPVLHDEVLGGAVPYLGRQAQQHRGEPEVACPLRVRHVGCGVAHEQVGELGQHGGDFGRHSFPITLRIARSWALSSHQAG